jgi:hypothetical protein
MGIYPEVEHWPISGGRLVSGLFRDELHFKVMVHYPNKDIKLQANSHFGNDETSDFKNGTVVNI